MIDVEEINRSISRALRSLNGIAVGIASLSLSNRDEALKEITNALEHVDRLQRIIVASDPGLEYHFDPNREPSQFMKIIAAKVEAAENCIKEGNLDAAEELLVQARNLEPPPLIYELLEKRILSLRKAN